MFIIGITGPSGSGKGEISKYLSSKGAKIIDADEVYHDVITPPSDCIDELVSNFGKEILTDTGAINRKNLALIVFGEENKEKLERLNKITHKYVIERINDIIFDCQNRGVDVCVIDAPLLIEAGIHKDCNFTMSALAQKDVRIERIMQRDGIDRLAANHRINSQKSDDFYKDNTDEVVYNDGDLSSLVQNIESILQKRRIPL